MRSSKVPALLALLLAGCFAQLEDQSVIISRPLCSGAPCVPGGSANLNTVLRSFLPWITFATPGGVGCVNDVAMSPRYAAFVALTSNESGNGFHGSCSVSVG